MNKKPEKRKCKRHGLTWGYGCDECIMVIEINKAIDEYEAYYSQFTPKIDEGKDIFGTKELKKKFPNIGSRLNVVILEFIDETPNLPDFIKPLTKEACIGYANTLKHILGCFELAWRRTKSLTPEECKKYNKPTP